MNNKRQNKITSYNVFIKDSFNIIYNRPCLNYLPSCIKNNIINYKNKKAYLIIIELAKIWKNFNNKNIVLKYKGLISKYEYFTNHMYENIIIRKTNILNNFYLYMNLKVSIIYLLFFYKFLINCLSNTNLITNVFPTPTSKYQ
jgi:hypothetical protein